MFSSLRAALVALVPICGLLAISGPANSAVNLVVNGDFEQETVNGVTGTNLGSYEFGHSYTTGGTAYNVAVTGWATTGYNFLFNAGTADAAGATGEYGNLKLWGPNDGSANGMPASSPTGGSFVAADGAFGIQPITQSIGGLTVGNLYQLTFWWAAAQQSGFDGTTTENWTVGFGGQSFMTSTVNNANHGFVPWTQVTMFFTATATTQTLSFLAAGTPNGTPPFSLLDGVSLTAAPEPATWALMMVGLVGIVLVSRRRQLARGTALPG